MSKQKQKGTMFETCTAADYVQTFGGQMVVVRNPAQGANDKGDIGGIFIDDFPVVVECKNYKTYDIARWIKELEREMANAQTPFGVVLFHKKGVNPIKDMDNQLVLMPNHVFKALVLRLKELEDGTND